MIRCHRVRATFLLLVAAAGCGTSSENSGAPNSTEIRAASRTSSTTASSTTTGPPIALKDPCALLTASDARALLAMDHEPIATKASSPLLTCAYSLDSGSETVALTVSTTKLSTLKPAVPSAKYLFGVGNGGFVAVAGRNAVAAWTRAGVTYELTWYTLETATRSADPDQVAALAHTVATRN